MFSHAGGIFIFVGGGFGLMTPYVLKKTGKISISGNYLTAVLATILVYTGIISGGHGSPPLMWFAAVPLSAYCMAGKRSGLFWLSLAIVGLILFYLVEVSGHPIVSTLPPGRMPLLQVSVLIGLSLLVIWQLLMYDAIMRSSTGANPANDRAVTEFLGSVSHELRTPLHAILNLAAFGRERAATASRDTLLVYFNRVQESGQRLQDLLNNLLALSQLEAKAMNYDFRSNDLREVIQQVQYDFDGLVLEKNLTLRCEFPPGPFTTICDRRRIEQVMRNLLSNALKYSYEGSAITVDVALAPVVTVSVTNRGIGIPADEMEAIFEKFYEGRRTRSGGIGLGLAISREIIGAHGGTIGAACDPEGKTTISFTLPNVMPRGCSPGKVKKDSNSL